MFDYLIKRRLRMMGVTVADPKPVPKPIAKQSAKKIAELAAEKPVRDGKNNWFADIEERECKSGVTTCWNCGEEILRPFMRAATAHILPKRKNMFPSVATHPLNYLILGAGCGCHNEYDRSWEDAAKMRIWPMAVERFRQFEKEISEEEKARVPEVFYQS